MRNKVIQRILIYLSIQTIALLEGLWLLLSESHGQWRWEFLLLAPAQLGSVWILIIEFFPNVWAWMYVLAIRAIRRRAFAEEPWSIKKRRVWVTVASAMLLLDTYAFVSYRIHDADVWSHVAMMLLALPLLLLPVDPKAAKAATKPSPIAPE